MNNSVVGLDIAKQVFHVYTIQTDGKVYKQMLIRKQVLTFFANYTSSLIGIEACGSSSYWARELIALGHEVKLLNARHVQALVKGNKNDFNDAEAIFDAVSRPNARSIAIKSIEQLDIQLIQRRGFNVAVVALANKDARILWALAHKGECYQPTGSAE